MKIVYGESQDSLHEEDATQAELVEIASTFPIVKIAEVTDTDIDANVTFLIPEGVTHIDDCAFYACRGLRSLVIPVGVTHIGALAFSVCKGLKSVVIPAGVTHIDEGAFSCCSGLISLVISEGVTHICDGAFSLCSRLTNLVISEGLTHIGDSAFFDCRGLTSLVIPVGVTHIGDKAFSNCRGLTSVVIPAGVTHIGEGAFEECSCLTEILVDTDNIDEFHRIKALLPAEHHDKVRSSSPVTDFYLKSADGIASEVPSLAAFSMFAINQMASDQKENIIYSLSELVIPPDLGKN